MQFITRTLTAIFLSLAILLSTHVPNDRQVGSVQIAGNAPDAFVPQGNEDR